ncbi:MAG: 3-hydroxybutyryl-CoA dehydrogenase [Actinobacteria bacterium]|nr:3-hydroxybutyryl-CoA dehydrogenase [Actinomycetota bacterium]
MEIRTVLVAGAGQMGNGIAQVSAQAGYRVVMTDIAQEFVDKGVASIEKNLGRAVEKGRLAAEDRDAALARITTALTFEAGRDADLFIEAAPESLDVKRDVFGKATAALGDGAIIASNTSSLSITRLAATAGCPERFVGIHFFNPVPAMALVEVISGLETAPETAAAARAFVESLGKVPVMANDSPGFVVNRILFPMINEAVYVLQEGVAGADDIDAAMKAGANHPMGPLALADLVGLDTTLAILEVLHRDLGDPKYRPCPLLRRYVAAGRLGRKSGAGFYSYG